MSKHIPRIIVSVAFIALCWFGASQWFRAFCWKDAALTGTAGAASLVSDYGNYWLTHKAWPEPGEMQDANWIFVRRIYAQPGPGPDDDVYRHISAHEPRLLLFITMSPSGKTETSVALGTGREFANAAKLTIQPTTTSVR